MENIQKIQNQEKRKFLQEIKIVKKIKEKIEMYKRTIEIAKKPDKEEFIYSAKVTVIGIGIIGIIGFILFVLYNLFM
ncbi:MAG: protein translocase SEC61 complex subunit gamma [Candidatus Aenigmatarchaeota archaeon]|nr:protein translocase SEC61 complex subunit gamma [Candidatus Aenigmarchaeota archaeon]